MAIPPLTALPAPPLATDTEAVFNAKADATLLAEKVFVDELNASTIPGINQAVTDTLAATIAAAASASAAGGSVTQAGLKVIAAAEQVALATIQAGIAAQSATNAQTYAAAAGAAAGLPLLMEHDAFDVLQINSAKTGVQWGKAGQSVGDILVTAKTPDATYAMTNRVIYLKSQFPDLAAMLGPLADADRSTVSVASINPSFPSETSSYTEIAQTENGSLIIALINNAPYPCVTSADKGATWVRRTTNFPAAPYSLACVNGVFVATFASQSIVYTSVDGVTWTSRGLPGIISSPNVFASSGFFIIYGVGQSSGIFFTSPDGITWTSRNTFSTIGVTGLTKAGAYLFATSNGNSMYGISADGGLSWFSVSPGYVFTSIYYYGGVYYATYNGNNSALFSTTNPLSTAWVMNVNAIPNAGNAWIYNSAVVVPQYKCIILPCSSVSAWISNDGGVTWYFRSNTLITFQSSLVIGNKLFFVQGNNGYSLPLFSYDIAVSFITPPVPAQPNPLTTYIKGKLV